MDAAFSEPEHSTPNGWGASRQTASVLLIGLTLVFMVSLLYRPSDGDYFSICVFKSLTGLPCPGCGLTHSFCALAKVQIGRSFLYNMLGPPLFVLAAGFWLRSIAVLLGKTTAVNAFDRFARGTRLARLFLLGLGVYGVGRIVYIVAFAPHLIQSAPLLKFIMGLFARL